MDLLHDTHILEPGWWYSAVVVAILVNLISSYLWKKIEVVWARRSAVRERRLEFKRSARADRIKRIQTSDRELLLAFRKESRLRSFALLLFVASVLVYTTSVPLALFAAAGKLISLTLMILGVHAESRAGEAASEIDAATEFDRGQK